MSKEQAFKEATEFFRMINGEITKQSYITIIAFAARLIKQSS